MKIHTLLLNQPLTPLWMPFYTVANALIQESLMSRHHDLLRKHLALHLHAKLYCQHQNSLNTNDNVTITINNQNYTKTPSATILQEAVQENIATNVTRFNAHAHRTVNFLIPNY